jgi:excisionase family DNA binding protein
MTPADLDSLLTVRELAHRLRLPPKRIRRAIRAGELPAVLIGEWLRVRARDAEEWLARREYRPR